MALTRGKIIAEGLSQAGRSDLTSNGRLWLNLFLEEQYENQDWAWLTKIATGLACTEGAALPSDYRAARFASLGSSKTPLRVIDDQEYDMRSGGVTTGTPTLVYINQLLKTAHFISKPTAGLTWNLTYYHTPVLPDHTDAASDLASPIWGLPDKVLVQAIFVSALEYNDDSRFGEESQRLDQMLGRGKMNNRDMRAGSPKFKLGKSFRKRV